MGDNPTPAPAAGRVRQVGFHPIDGWKQLFDGGVDLMAGRGCCSGRRRPGTTTLATGTAKHEFDNAMKHKLSRLSEQSLAALSRQVKPGAKARSQPAIRPGRQAVDLGLTPLGLAQFSPASCLVAPILMKGCS